MQLFKTNSGRIVRKLRDRRGQGLVEYLILVALVAVAAISVVSVVGTNVREQYGKVSNSLRNNKADKGKDMTEVKDSDTKKRGMDDYAE